MFHKHNGMNSIKLDYRKQTLSYCGGILTMIRIYVNNKSQFFTKKELLCFSFIVKVSS